MFLAFVYRKNTMKKVKTGAGDARISTAENSCG
jgi:hypothetical protein